MIEIGKPYAIVNSKAGNDGLIVTVTGFAGKYVTGFSMEDGDRWSIDRYVKTHLGNVVNHVGEKQLKPIYDGDEKR